MSRFRGRIRISLYARFMFAIALILVLLVGSILLVIEKREVHTIFEQAKDRGLLIAANIANLNLERLKFWDAEGTKKSLDALVDENLVYAVVFDRFNSLFAASDFALANEALLESSRLSDEAKPGDVAITPRRVARGGRSVPVIEIEIPVFATGSPTKWGSVKVGLSLEEMREEIRRTRLVLILIGCGGFLLGTGGAALLAKRITGPMKKLVEGTVRISRGDFSQNIEVASGDEIGELARSFNSMTEDLLQARRQTEEANRRLLQAEKLASIGRIAATIAHEIRNPLTSVKLNIQKLMENESLGEEETEHLNLSQEGILQIEKFIKEMLNFSRVSDLNPERFSIVQILEEAVKILKGSLEEKKISLVRNYADSLPQVVVDGDKMRQVFLNILRNGVEACETGGRISLSLSLTGNDAGRSIKVRIADDGCGIPEKDWENIFEPFFTTKSTGIGLGLANAKKIVEQHRGVIKVVKKKGKGTAFEVLIPCEGER